MRGGQILGILGATAINGALFLGGRCIFMPSWSAEPPSESLAPLGRRRRHRSMRLAIRETPDVAGSQTWRVKRVSLQTELDIGKAWQRKKQEERTNEYRIQHSGLLVFRYERGEDLPSASSALKGKVRRSCRPGARAWCRPSACRA